MFVKCAKTIVKAIQITRSYECKDLPKALLGKTSAGQCHKYSGYEILPNHCARRLLERSLNMGGHTGIEAINKAVAKTGRRAFRPGKAVLSLNLNDAVASAIKPIQGRMRCLNSLDGMKSNSAPIPSSQARVGRE